jgi:hypothetical protein
MDLRSVRALVVDLNFRTHGVPALVTFNDPELGSIDTTGIWLPELEEDAPYGSDLRRRDPRRLMALPRNVLATMPRGTTVDAPDRSGDVVKSWRVDGLGRHEAEIWRVILIPLSTT